MGSGRHMIIEGEFVEWPYRGVCSAPDDGRHYDDICGR